MKASPHGSNLFDLRMHYSLFFVNLMSAVDLVSDNMTCNKENSNAFIDRIKNGFEKNDYYYVRELRNSVVHRGFNPSAASHSDQTALYALCPATVEHRDGKTTYSCTLKHLPELAHKCRQVIDPAISDILEKLNLFDPQLHEPNRAETMNAIDNATEMPDWAKVLAKHAFDRMDFAEAASKLAKSRVDNMRKLLA